MWHWQLPHARRPLKECQPRRPLGCWQCQVTGVSSQRTPTQEATGALATPSYRGVSPKNANARGEWALATLITRGSSSNNAGNGGIGVGNARIQGHHIKWALVQ
ncbi:hypothetical protein AAHE18_03G160900 [Arachis hypogaea]